MVAGPSSDIINVAVSKVNEVVTITRPSTNVHYLSLKIYFTAAQIGANTSCNVTFPETSGQTVLGNIQRPAAIRYTASTYASGVLISTVALAGSDVTITIGGLTAGQDNYIQLIW
jgi:hypothetical protein